MLIIQRIKTGRSRYNEKEITKKHKKLNRRNPVTVYNIYEKQAQKQNLIKNTGGKHE